VVYGKDESQWSNWVAVLQIVIRRIIEPEGLGESPNLPRIHRL
jgi:hypothetical protein